LNQEKIPFEKYKPRLKDYFRQKGIDASADQVRCFNTKEHKHGDTIPSLSIYEDSFFCFGCGVKGDIYDAVELLEGITDKKEQYFFIERLFGGGSVEPTYTSVWGKDGDKFKPDITAMQKLEDYLSRNIKSNKMIRQFLDDRARISTAGTIKSYPEDSIPILVKQFYYWPGFDIALQELQDRNILKQAGIPQVHPQKGYSTWGHSGVVIKLGRGYKLHYYMDNECKKFNSKGGTTFPMPGNIDKTKPVILVEGEMDAISALSIGIENVFATGGTQGLTGPKIKEYLLEVPELILCFDADEAGRKASGLIPFDDGDKRKSNVPQTILKAGYTGKIRIAEIPPDCGYKDQDALILAGKGNIIVEAITHAKAYISPPAQPEKKKKHVPLIKFENLGLKRLCCILRKLPRKDIEDADMQPFISACMKTFKYPETQAILAEWGASTKELKTKDGANQIFLLDIAEKYLSRYLKRQIEKEIMSAGESLTYIKINHTKVAIDFDELETNENAVQFIKNVNIRSAALLITDMFEERIIYNDAKNDKKFYFFNGHVWEHAPDIAGVIHDALIIVLHFFMKEEISEAKNTKEQDSIAEFYINKINRIGSRRMRVEIEHELAKIQGIYHNTDNKEDPLKFDSRDNIKETITLIDGVLDFSGKELVFRKSKPQEYRQKTLNYTIEKVKDGLSCPKFHAFMAGNFKNNATLEMFLYYLSLIPSMIQYKYGAFFLGGKNAGKSTTIKLIKELYGHLVGFMEKDVLTPKGRIFAAGNSPTPYIAALPGLGASIVNESDDGSTLNEALWKSLTGNDAITARGLNEAPKDFINTAQIIIQTNQMPKFNRHDDAIIERMIVIPFLEQHNRTDEDKKEPDDFINELRPEFPAIIRLLAEYYIKLKHTLRGTIPISKESETYKSDYISELDSDLDKYISECLIFDKKFYVVIKSMYEHYKNYHDFNDDSIKRGEGLSHHKFSKTILKNYKNKITAKVQRINGKPTRCFIGVRIKTLDELQEQPETEENPFI
jgi:phage/plasmid-associated DNA primase